MAITFYNNDSELTISIKDDTLKIEFSVDRATGELMVAQYEDGKDEPAQDIVLPPLPGMAVLGSFLGNPETILAMIGYKRKTAPLEVTQ
jgi:hypothetical protein